MKPTTEQIKTLLNNNPELKIPQITSDTHFWMIRTKKGYFYNEFLSKSFVALAWNLITQETSLTPSNMEAITDTILVNYKEIKRAGLLINKCKNFIYEIKPNDILVIPSAGSKYITFAYAGEYYEEENKTYELEREIINKIENREVLINDVSCPYRKRRKIDVITTVHNECINYHLYKAISSYHGICNLDDYATIILDHLFNCYAFNNDVRMVFHVTKKEPITSTEFSGLLYSASTLLSLTDVPEENISTQASIHSLGDIVFTLKEGFQILSDHSFGLCLLFLILIGGKGCGFELPGLAKTILNYKDIDNKMRRSDAETSIAESEANLKKLECAEKFLQFEQELREKNIDSNEFYSHLNTITNCSASMQITDVLPSTTSLSSSDVECKTDDEESVQ